MAKITLNVGGRSYGLTCRDGEEGHLLQLAALIDSKCTEANATLGVMPEPRLLLTAALLIADELTELRKASSGSQSVQTAPAKDEPARDEMLEALADHIESLCTTLERRVVNP